MGHTRQEKKIMLLSALVSQYADYLDTAKPLSKTTRTNYLCRVRRYREYLCESTEGRLQDMTRASLMKWVHRVASHSPDSTRMHYAALKHFCRWLVAEDWLRTSPAEGIPLPKVSRRRRDTIPDDVVCQLMDAIDRLPVSDYRRALIRAALSLMVYGGLRITEALFVRVGDIRLDRGEVWIPKTKGDKSKTLFLCKEASDAIRALLRVRPDCEHDFLLAHNRRYALRWHGLRSALNDLHTVAGITDHYTPHQLRHAYATRLLRNGATLADVQLALGHSRLDTTALYIHSDTERLRSIAHLASLTAAAQHPTQQNAPAQPGKQERRRVAVRRLR